MSLDFSAPSSTKIFLFFTHDQGLFSTRNIFSEAEEELAALRKTIDNQQLTITEQLVALEDCTCKEERQNYSDAHVSRKCPVLCINVYWVVYCSFRGFNFSLFVNQTPLPLAPCLFNDLFKLSINLKYNHNLHQDAELESRFQQLMEETERIEKNREDLRKEKEELRLLENKIKEDVS